MLRSGFQVVALSILAFWSVPGFARDWVAYSTDNFTVYSDRPERQILRILERFELFRQVALGMLEAPDEPENERLRIFMFDRNVDFNRIQGEMSVGGFFYHSISGPRMLVSPDGRDETLFHEYVHYLMDRHSTANYPRWYGEGLAELLESIEIGDETIRVGLPASNYEILSWLGALTGDGAPLVPVSEMVAIQPRVGVGPFYATAWLMTHYLLIDSLDDPDRLGRTADYLLRFDAGEDPVEAITTSFGISPDELDARLLEYARQREFKTIVFPARQYAGGHSSRTLTEAESLYLLADLAVELGEYDAAAKYIRRFERRGDDSPLAPRVEAINAIAFIHQHDTEEGDSLIDELLAGDANDADGLAEIMHYSIDRVLFAPDEGLDSGKLLNRAIAIGELVLQQDPDHLETLFYLGRAHELSGHLDAAAMRLLEFYAINPTAPSVNLLLAKVFIVGGNAGVGSEFLARAYSAIHLDEARSQLDEIRNRIDDVGFVTESIEGLLALIEGHAQ